jgi:hypothetical protein
MFQVKRCPLAYIVEYIYKGNELMISPLDNLRKDGRLFIKRQIKRNKS